MCETLENTELHVGVGERTLMSLSPLKDPATLQVSQTDALIQSFQQHPQFTGEKPGCQKG